MAHSTLHGQFSYQHDSSHSFLFRIWSLAEYDIDGYLLQKVPGIDDAALVVGYHTIVLNVFDPYFKPAWF